MDHVPTPSITRYQYDALDRLVSHLLAGQQTQALFYQKDRFVTEIQGASQRQIFLSDDVLLAEMQSVRDSHISLLMTDGQRSVIQTTGSRSSYTPYGHRASGGEMCSVLGYTGERIDSVTRHYLLGNGHRAFNPVLMRFNSPDSLSPFGKGGRNCYAYCEGDPVNRRDPTGKWSVHGWFANAFLEVVGDYVVPYIPRRAVAWIPGVGNRNFGRVSKGASKFLGVTAAASYMALNRFDAYAYTEPLYNSLFAAHLAISVASTVSTAASTLHKIARKGVVTTPILVRHQRNSVNTISETISEPVGTRNSLTFSPNHSSLPNTPVPEPANAGYNIRNSS